jgi:LuxR family maltose regulon positive regulatory protein
LRTKLYPAHAEGASAVGAFGLIERLLEAREQRLMVLSAPAGFGKSTVLSQLRSRLQAQGARVAWLSCDESDSEPARLLQYLVAAVAAVCPGFGSSATALLQGEISWPLEAAIDAFIDDLKGLPQDLYLMLDDFHRIRHPTLGQSSRYLIERLPKQVRLVASTRHQPRFLDESPAFAAGRSGSRPRTCV